jgi:hypothetical protein
METLSCNNCGEMIELPTTANYATCARCGTHLVVRRGETARYTEVLDAEAPVRSDAAERQIEIGTVNDAEFESMKLKLALLSLDHEWEDKRAPYMVRGNRGVPIEPSKAGAAAFLVLGLLMSIIIMVAFIQLTPNLSISQWLEVSIIGVVLPLAICGWMAKQSHTRYQEYISAKREYLGQRRKLTRASRENTKRLPS